MRPHGAAERWKHALAAGNRIERIEHHHLKRCAAVILLDHPLNRALKRDALYAPQAPSGNRHPAAETEAGIEHLDVAEAGFPNEGFVF